MAEPTPEQVCELHHVFLTTTDSDARAKVNQWLTEFSKSRYAWTVCDQLLSLPGVPSPTQVLAATTLKAKTKSYIDELSAGERMGFRDSLAKLLHAHQAGEKGVVTQLAVCLADLAVHMETWEEPLKDTMGLLSGDPAGYSALLSFLEALPLEASDSAIRIAPSRRRNLRLGLGMESASMYPFLEHCFQFEAEGCNREDIHKKALKCLAAWLEYGGDNPSLRSIASSNLLPIMFHAIGVPHLMDEASSAITCAVYLSVNNGQERLRAALRMGIFELRAVFEKAIVAQDVDVGQALGQIFAELCDSSVQDTVAAQNQHTGEIIDLNLLGVSFPDQKVARMNFRFWMDLAEELDLKIPQRLQLDEVEGLMFFRPYYLRLCEQLTRHCCVPDDQEGILTKDDDIAEFRDRVAYMMNMTAWITGGSVCIGEQAVQHISSNTSHWPSIEANLFLIQNIMIPSSNKELLGTLLPFICSHLGEGAHVMLRDTAIIVIAKFSHWISTHASDCLESVFQYCLTSLNTVKLQPSAISAISALCRHCRESMHPHYADLMMIMQARTSLRLKQDSVLEIFKGIGRVISSLPPANIQEQFSTFLGPVLKDLGALVSSDGEPNVVVLVDTLEIVAEIFKSVNVPGKSIVNDVHPCMLGVEHTWPLLQTIFSKYGQSVKLVEHANRALKLVLRCLDQHAIGLVKPVVLYTLEVFKAYQHSSCLYIGKILVELFGANPAYTEWLLEMLSEFSTHTFAILTASDTALNDHPDIVEDFFRLINEMLLKQPLQFLLRQQFLESCIDCAIASILINHTDSNEMVCVFVANMAGIVRSLPDKTEEHKAMQLRASQIIGQVLECKGQALIQVLITASCGVVPTHFVPAMSDTLWSILRQNRELCTAWVAATPKLAEVPNRLVTQEDKERYIDELSKAQKWEDVRESMRYFARLWDR